MKGTQSSEFSESATMDTKYRPLNEDYNPYDHRSSFGKLTKCNVSIQDRTFMNIKLDEKREIYGSFIEVEARKIYIYVNLPWVEVEVNFVATIFV